jgi:WD40 repeat protein
MAFALAQPLVATGGEDSIVNIFSTDSYRRTGQLTDAARSIMSIGFSPTDSFLLTASWDNKIRVYKSSTMTLVHTCSDNRDCVNDATFVADDRFISVCRDHTVKLFDVNRSTPVYGFTSSSTPYSLTAIQGESLVVTAHHDGKLRAWDFRSRGTPMELHVHKLNIMQVLGQAGSARVVSLGADKTVTVSDMRTKTVERKVSIAQSGMPSEKMQMALWRGHVMIGGTSGDVYDYDLGLGKVAGVMKGHKGPVFCVAVKGTVGPMASGDKSGVVRFWMK